MKIFIDSANLKEIEKWLNYGIIDGVTTNPSIMLKDGVYDLEDGIKKIAKLIEPFPLSAEVTTNDGKEMVEQAKRRTFTAKYKAEILAKADACTAPGEVGQFLHASPGDERRLAQVIVAPHARFAARHKLTLP